MLTRYSLSSDCLYKTFRITFVSENHEIIRFGFLEDVQFVLLFSPILWNWDTADVNLPCATCVFWQGLSKNIRLKKYDNRRCCCCCVTAHQNTVKFVIILCSPCSRRRFSCNIRIEGFCCMRPADHTSESNYIKLS